MKLKIQCILCFYYKRRQFCYQSALNGFVHFWTRKLNLDHNCKKNISNTHVYSDDVWLRLTELTGNSRKEDNNQTMTMWSLLMKLNVILSLDCCCPRWQQVFFFFFYLTPSHLYSKSCSTCEVLHYEVLTAFYEEAEPQIA